MGIEFAGRVRRFDRRVVEATPACFICPADAASTALTYDEHTDMTLGIAVLGGGIFAKEAVRCLSHSRVAPLTDDPS